MIDDTLFIKTFGDSPALKVLMFLLENNIFDYPKTEIARNVHISRTTLNTFWDEFVKRGIIKKTRSIGRATFYQIDMGNQIVKKTNALNNVICKAYSNDLVEPVSVPA
ncbi:MAG: hypothetical protein U9Q22_00760 [Candidatus Altiarchaeota archaeon]|nr:hypothetical protein [Candidatus Altiarchaeota archaeon]